MAGNNGGPWGGGGGNSGGGGRPNGGSGGGNRGSGGGGPRGPGGEGPQIPEIDELVKKGQERLRVLMGGKGGGGTGGGRGEGGGGPAFTRGTVGLIALGAVGAWLMASLYTVAPEEQSVELFLGEYSATGNPGLNFAPWPLVTAEVLPVTREQTEDIGSRVDSGLMLTTDENIIDIDFQVVWNINDPAKYLFNLAEPQETIRAVSESAMREVIARSELAPILNRDRQVIADEAEQLIQTTLDAYESGVNIVRLNLDKADPPREVIDADQRLAQPHRKALGGHHAGQNASDQAGPGCHRYGIDVGQGEVCIVQCRFDHQLELLGVGPRSQFWNHAAESCVQIGLACNDVRQDRATAIGIPAHDCGRGVVATALDAEHGERLI